MTNKGDEKGKNTEKWRAEGIHIVLTKERPATLEKLRKVCQKLNKGREF